jgi:hypothetical protein
MERIYLEISHIAGSHTYNVRGMWSSSEFPGTQLKSRDIASSKSASPLDDQALWELTAAVANEISGWQSYQPPLF